MTRKAARFPPSLIVFDGDSDDDENDNLVGSNVALFEYINTLLIPIDALARDRHRDSM